MRTGGGGRHSSARDSSPPPSSPRTSTKTRSPVSDGVYPHGLLVHGEPCHIIGTCTCAGGEIIQCTCIYMYLSAITPRVKSLMINEPDRSAHYDLTRCLNSCVILVSKLLVKMASHSGRDVHTCTMYMYVHVCLFIRLVALLCIFLDSAQPAELPW